MLGVMANNRISTDFAFEAAKGTPAVAAAAWTMNDVLIAISIAYVVFQCLYLARKWWREEKERRSAE
jgi:uncharacterized PurR-regulated membrane protein YhhQ (DUF165 family)